MPIDWTSCPDVSLPWFEVRGLLLQVLFTPWMLSLVTGLLFLSFISILPFPLRWQSRGLIVVSGLLLVNSIYSPLATEILSSWLSSQLPASIERGKSESIPVAVLVGRGPQIAEVTTAEASRQLNTHNVSAVYVSGDQRSTVKRLLKLGVPPESIAGDSCARTTWENATRTTQWLRSNHPRAAVMLITDPWQLPRATAAFRRQGLVLVPISVEPALSASERNRLVLRETAGAFIYRLQGRM